MLHEIAHMFGPPEMGWLACSETMANLKVAYAAEKLGVQFGFPPEYGTFVSTWSATGNFSTYRGIFRGTQYRMYEFDKARRNLINGYIKPFAACAFGGSVFDFYIFGLIEEIGWEPYRKAFHSYLDRDFTPAYTYSGERAHTRARDFLDRLVHFSGSPNLLSNGPDNGRLLEVFEVTRTPRNQMVERLNRP